MIGRGAYGRPWIPASIDRALAGNATIAEPGLVERVAIVLEHLADSLRFYGDALGLKIFRKHLGWYIEQAPCPTSAGCTTCSEVDAVPDGLSRRCRGRVEPAVAQGLCAVVEARMPALRPSRSTIVADITRKKLKAIIAAE